MNVLPSNASIMSLFSFLPTDLNLYNTTPADPLTFDHYYHPVAIQIPKQIRTFHTSATTTKILNLIFVVIL